MRPRRPNFAPVHLECDLTARGRAIAAHRYAFLHEDGQRLIRDWVDRGLGLQRDGENFEGFIFLWIGVNAWAACVTDEDVDARMVDCLARDAH
jgi:hypothetical protein